MSLDLRPLTLGELLDRSFSLYRHHFWLFVGIMALPSLLGLAFGLLVALFNPQPASPGSVDERQSRRDPRRGAVVRRRDDRHARRLLHHLRRGARARRRWRCRSSNGPARPRFARRIAPLRGRVGRLALLLVLVSIRLVGIVLLMFVLCRDCGRPRPPPGFRSLGGLVVVLRLRSARSCCGSGSALRYAVSVPAAVLEDETATDAIRRSIELTRGSLLRVFVLLAFTMVITYAVLAVFQGPFLIVGAMAGPESSTFFWMNLLGTITGLDRRRLHGAADDRGLCGSLLRSSRPE